MEYIHHLVILLLLFFLITNVACNQNKDGTSLVDERDGKTYETFEYGNQIWMAENLNYRTDKGSWIYDDDPSFAEEYGRLYEWEHALRVCPDGWRLPTYKEWNLMVNNLREEAGEILKKEDHLSLDLGGFRYDEAAEDYCQCAGTEGVYWSATEFTDSEHPDRAAWALSVFSFTNKVELDPVNKGYGFSVRCLKTSD